MGKIQRLFRRTLGLIMSEIVTDDAQMQCRCKRRGIILLLGVFIFVCINTKSQNQIKPKTRIEHFHKKKFEKEVTETLKNGDKCSYVRVSDRYIIFVTSKDTPYEYTSTYDDRGRLRAYIKSFDDMTVGKSYEYDELGNIVKTMDNDAPYKFTLADLIKKIKAEYKIDIMDRAQVIEVHRAGTDPRLKELKYKTYALVFCSKSDSMLRHEVLVNADTGETLFSTLKPKGEGSVYFDYLDSLKNSSSGSITQYNSDGSVKK